MAAVERGLSVVGEDFAKVTLYNLDVRYSLGRLEISKKPERFVQALRDMFGDGAELIETFIKEAVCAHMGLKPNAFERPSLLGCIREVLGKATEDESPRKSNSENHYVLKTYPTSSSELHLNYPVPQALSASLQGSSRSHRTER